MEPVLPPANDHVPFTPHQNRTLTINGKEYRITSLSIGGNAVHIDQLKSKDMELLRGLETLLGSAINSESKESSYTISLNQNSAIVNANESELKKEAKATLTTVHNLGSALLETQKQEKILAKKHTFKSDIPSELKATAIKTAILALAILASPLILLTALVVRGGAKLSEFASAIKHAVLKTDDLNVATKKMKEQEWINKFNGLQEVHQKFVDPIAMPKLFENTKLLKFSLQNKTERHIERALIKTKTSIDRGLIKQVVSHLEIDDFKNEDALKAKLFTHMPKLDTVLDDAALTLLVNEAKGAFVNSQEKDEAAFQELQSALSVNPSDYKEADKRILRALREVINSPTYQAVKENPEDPYVHYVSSIACAFWNSVSVMPEYQEFGKTVLNHVDKENLNNPNLTPGEQQRTTLEEAHKKTKQEIYTDHGLPAKMLYAFTHPKQALGSMASEGGVLREITSAFSETKYDPHLEYSNSPSLQGVTTATFTGGLKASINNCYGGSPTIGDRYQTVITPEFHAVCQAAENKRFATNKDPFIPDVVYYTNLQNIENPHGEGERSFAIMELNSKYPLSFFGMTLAKDSSFYFGKGEYADKPWDGAENFGKEMLKIFENPKCYQYGNRTKTLNKQGEYKGGNGIYLPHGQDTWLGADGKSGPIPQIIGKANERFNKIEEQLKNEGKPLDPVKLRGAYQEYVYSLIQAHTELYLAKAALTGNNDVKIMAVRACKENIDRGGAENAKYMHSRLGDELQREARDQLVVGALESRALLARGRVILEKRLPHPLSFIELVRREDFQQDLADLSSSTGLQLQAKPTYVPSGFKR